MFRNKKQKTNQYGTFAVASSHKKKMRIFVMALIVVVFVSGISLAVYKKINKPQQQAVIVETKSVIPGWWNQKYFESSVCDSDACKPEADPDSDKLTNEQEYYFKTDPNKSHTVGDKLSDGELVAAGYDPSQPGRVTFEKAISEDNILGEGLVFDQDVKKIINEMTDMNKVKLPEVKTEELILNPDNSKESNKKYLDQINMVAFKYFNFDVGKALDTAAQNGDQDAVDEIKTRSVKLLSEMKTISVPADAIELHKYYIALFGLIPNVITLPVGDGPESDIWFENTQAYIVLLQKSSQERANFEKSLL